MKKFLHPKLGRTTEGRIDGYDVYYAIITPQHDKFSLRSYTITEEQLIALGFEEVVEEVVDKEKEPDWIDALFDEFSEFKTSHYRKEFREIIEKHIQKQKKFTKREVRGYMTRKYGEEYPEEYENCIFPFLRDHNLLEE